MWPALRASGVLPLPWSDSSVTAAVLSIASFRLTFFAFTFFRQLSASPLHWLTDTLVLFPLSFTPGLCALFTFSTVAGPVDRFIFRSSATLLLPQNRSESVHRQAVYSTLNGALSSCTDSSSKTISAVLPARASPRRSLLQTVHCRLLRVCRVSCPHLLEYPTTFSLPPGPSVPFLPVCTRSARIWDRLALSAVRACFSPRIPPLLLCWRSKSGRSFVYPSIQRGLTLLSRLARSIHAGAT